MVNFSSCTSSSSSSTSLRTRSRSRRVEDSRDVLKAMILREEKHYKCPNYLSLDYNNTSNSHIKNKTVNNCSPSDNNAKTTTCTSSSSSSSSSSSLSSLFVSPSVPPQQPSAYQIIEEISNLFTDVRTMSVVPSSSSSTATLTRRNSTGNSNSLNNNNKDIQEIQKLIKKREQKCVSPVSSADDLYALANPDETTPSTTTTTTTSDLLESQQQQQQSPSFGVTATPVACRQRHRLTSHDTHCLSSWRNQMYDWACTVRDSGNYFDINDMVLEIAFNILDRYIAVELSTSATSMSSTSMLSSATAAFNSSSLPSLLSLSTSSSRSSSSSLSSFYDNDVLLPVTREDFQLFAMVSIYIASKLVINRSQHHYYHLHNHECHDDNEKNNSKNNNNNNNKSYQHQQQQRHQKQYLDVLTLIDMSQGYYTENDITTTERDILSALNWHVHPPTIIDYCDIFLDLFQRSNNNNNNLGVVATTGHNHNHTSMDKEKQMVHCRCKHIITDVVLTDGEFFLDKPHSVIALAVVLLATDAARSGRSNGGDNKSGGCTASKNRKSSNSSSSSSRRRSTYCDTDYVLQTFLQNIQGVVNVNEYEFDSIIRRLECSC